MCALADMALKMGVAIKEREALALFGRVDARRAGALGYLDVTECFFSERERILFQQNPRNCPPVLDGENLF